MSQTTEKLDLWCLVELFGHTKIAGRCTEQNIAGANMLRIDVPETTTQPAFTRFYGSSAIYSINPMDSFTAKEMAEKLCNKPIESWNIKSVMDKFQKQLSHQSVTPESGDAIDDDDLPY